MAPQKDIEEDFTVVSTKRHRRSSGKDRKNYIIHPRDKSETKQTRHQNKQQPCSENVTGNPTAKAPSTGRRTPTKVKAENSAHLTFVGECLKQGLVLEGLVIEYTIIHNNPMIFNADKVSGNADDLLKKMTFIHPHGDHFTILNLAREWMRQVVKKNVKAWCETAGIIQEELTNMENYLERRRKEMKISPKLFTFSLDTEKADAELKRILVELNKDGLCVFRGHPDLGYWSVSKWRTLHLHHNSLLRKLGSYGKHILVLHDITMGDVIYNALVLDKTEGESIMSDKFGSYYDILNEMTVEATDLEIPSRIIRDELHQRFGMQYEGSMKQRVMDICNDTKVFLSKKDTGFKLFSSPNHTKNIRSLLQEECKVIKSELSSRLYELPYPEIGSHCRALVSSGDVIEKVLLPHHYRGVLIRETSPDTLKLEHVMDTMSKYGEVDSIKRQNDEDRRADGKWGIVTFKKPESVQEVLANYAKCENMLVELAPLYENQQSQKYSLDRMIHVKASYCRRPLLSGKASVNFRARKDFSKALRTKEFLVKGRKIFGLKAGPNETFTMEGLHILTDEADIISGLETVGLTPNDVILHREKPFECLAGELEKFKAGLTKVLDKVTDLRKVNVQVIKAEKEDLFLQADITFDDQRTANSALENLNKTKFHGQPLNILYAEGSRKEGAARVTISYDLYNVVQSDLEILLKKSKQKQKVDVTITSSAKGMDLTLGKDSPPHIIDLFLRGLEDIISPTTVVLKRKNLRYLTMGKGNAMLDAVQTKAKCLIDMVDNSVHIYGSPTAKSEGVKMFKAFLVEKSYWYKFLSGDNDSNSLDGVARVVAKYGSALAHLVTGEKMFDVRNKAFIFSSPDVDTMQTVLRAFRDCFKSGKEEELQDCSACFCTPDTANDIYTLEICGHSYCTECIQEHVKHALNDHKFPIQCANESCGESICVPELLRLAKTTFKDGFEYLSKLTIDDYVAKHVDEWTYCFKPNCHGIAFKDNRFEAYSCHSCYAAICKSCLCTWHRGDCEDFLNRRALDQWFSDHADRRKCPNCKMGIEKVDGCNRVHCSTCQVHICWRCMNYYKDMQGCYDHLNKEHGGPY